MTSLEEHIQMNIAMDALRQPVLRQAVRALDLPAGGKGLDAGSGLGFLAPLLAEAVGSKGYITGVDVSAEFVEYAAEMAAKAGLSDRIYFRTGDVNRLPFPENSFDWAWSVDMVGYAPMDPLPAVKELVRVVKPGGKIALLAWSSERLLPGYPELEARLSATTAGIAPFTKAKQPELHFTRALGWFQALGFEGVAAHTFAGGAHAPLTGDQRLALMALFEMRWPGVEAELSMADWREFQRLCLPSSTEYLLDQPDYYAFFTYSMFQGTVPE